MEEFRVLDPQCKGRISVADLEQLMATELAEPEETPKPNDGGDSASPSVSRRSSMARMDMFLPQSSRHETGETREEKDRHLARKVVEELLAHHTANDAGCDIFEFCQAVLKKHTDIVREERKPKKQFKTLRDLVHAAVEAEKAPTPV